MEGMAIMYVGLQFAPHYDRANRDMSRIFNGPGDIALGVPPIQAAKLLSVGVKEGAPEYIDVTRLGTEERLEKAKAVHAESEEAVRKLKAPANVPGNERNVDAWSDDELEAELARRRAARGIVEAAPQVKQTNVDPNAQAQGVQKSDAEIAKLGAAAVERILEKSKDNPALLNEEGAPTHAALQEELGFSITEDEYKVALGL